jgi:hypothetical protein
MKAFSIALMLVCLTAAPAPATAQEVLISNLDHFSFLIFQRFTATQWLTAAFTTDGNSYELESFNPAVKATTLTAGIVAELRSGVVPGPLITTLTRDPGVPIIFRPDTPVTLEPNTTYHFSLGYPQANTTISDWYTTENFDTVGPATLEQGYVSSNQGATWATGGFLTDERFFFEVIAVPEPTRGLAAAAALAAVALARRSKAA